MYPLYEGMECTRWPTLLLKEPNLPFHCVLGTRLNEKTCTWGFGWRVHVCFPRARFSGDRLLEKCFERWLSNSIWRSMTIARCTCACVLFLALLWEFCLTCDCQCQLMTATNLTCVAVPILARQIVYSTAKSFTRRPTLSQLAYQALKNPSWTKNGCRSSAIPCSRWFFSSLERHQK